MADRRRTAWVTWANPDAPNLGVRALAEGTSALLSTLGDVDVHYPIFEREPLRSLLSTRSLVRGLVRPGGQLARMIAEIDVLVETGGGDSFTDIYGIPRLARMHHIHRAAASVGVPVVFGPQTIGPFRTRAGRILARRMLHESAVVIARDSTSAQAAERLGRAPDAVATDVVFGLQAPPEAGATHDVAMTVSGLLWDNNPHVDAGAYRAATRELIVGLLADGRAVTFVPHVLDNASPDNDVPLARALAREFPSAELIVPESLSEVRQVLASSRLVIGSRMHACLNALSTGTPAIPWAYSRKFLPLLGDLGWNAGVDLRSEIDVAPARTRELAASERLGEGVPAVRALASERLAAAAAAIGALGSVR